MKKKTIYTKCLSTRSMSFLLAGAFMLFLATGCSDQTLLTSDEPETQSVLVADEYPALEAEMKALKIDLEGRIAAPAKTGNVVVVPGGSVDALADAIAEAGPGGTVVLATGTHKESETVKITQQVSIVGEPNAVLEVSTDLPEDAAFAVSPSGAALYVHNAANVVIWGVEVRPTDQIGGVAILLEHSPHTVVGENRLYDHQFGIIISKGDHTKVWKNKVVTASPGELLHPFTPQGIISLAGHVKIARNEISNAVTGIFLGDEKGLLVENESHGNVLGFVFCTFLPPMPGPGEPIAAEFSATQWVAQHNNAHDNFFVGYYVYDGANNNLLANNAASNNAVLDIILTQTLPREGLPDAPATFENHVVAGRYHDIKIQDCGVDNKVDGGTRVPC